MILTKELKIMRAVLEDLEIKSIILLITSQTPPITAVTGAAIGNAAPIRPAHVFMVLTICLM
jgi:hypothetical protein